MDEKRLIDANALIAEFEWLQSQVSSTTALEIQEHIQRIKDAPTVDAVEVVHGRWEKTKQHLWYMEDGEIDMYRYESGFHNGPVCRVCGASFCINCELDWDKTECYDHHFKCSECGEDSIDGHENYCPNCGAKMDGGETNES